MKAKIRKIMTVVDETLTEQDRQVTPPIRRAAAIAVIALGLKQCLVDPSSEQVDVDAMEKLFLSLA